jgi:hypothetical protein
MTIELLSAFVVIVAFAPIALRHLAPATRGYPAVYHALAALQIAVSVGLFAALPLKDFLMFWAILPAGFGAWHVWQAAGKARPSKAPDVGARRLAPGE